MPIRGTKRRLCRFCGALRRWAAAQDARSWAWGLFVVNLMIDTAWKLTSLLGAA